MTMIESNVDVDAYCKRIGYVGGRDASLQTLSGIVRRHTETIAFENLNPLTGQPVNLDPATLQRKIIDAQRGGYCFEQNLLLRNVLQQLGFRVTGLAARVMWNLPETTVLARTHMLLLVKLDNEPHVVDVGFGGLVLTGVLKLQTDIEQNRSASFAPPTPSSCRPRCARNGDRCIDSICRSRCTRTTRWPTGTPRRIPRHAS
jgi:N-hydroxyarylamine O-acetyltransferase